MKNLFKKFIFVSLLVFLFISNNLFAEDVVNSFPFLSIDTLVDVPFSCEVSDTDNVTHTYTASSTDSYLGICVLKAALDLGDISSVKLSNQYPSMGLFVTSFNDIEAESSSQYWALYQNEVYADSGLSTLPVSIGDIISFKLSDFTGIETADSVVIRVNSLIELPAVSEEPEFEIMPEEEIASISIHLNIISDDNSLFNDNLSVNSCDSDNDPETPDIITAYCSLLQSGLESKWNWAWAPGAFVDSISDITGYTSQDNQGNDVYHYWSWSLNGEMAMTALNQYELQTDDLILLEFIDPQEEIDQEDLAPEPTPEEPTSGGGGSYTPPIEKTFSISEALSFLSSKQNPDGSFSSDMYTDWVAIAIAKAGDEAQIIKTKIYNYLVVQDFNSSIITDYERHAMALMALNINPYSGTNIDYIKKITDSFDGQQIGDSSLYNDDIFGLIVLVKAGYLFDENIISKTIDFIISKQQDNGSWDNIDITAAAIQVLNNFIEVDGVSESILKGLNYLSSVQNSNGGFGNSFSTSWASQALSLNNTFVYQTNKTLEFLVNLQQDDGGVDSLSFPIESRIWATSYVIPAVLKLSWNDILNNFSKPVVTSVSSSSSALSYSQEEIIPKIIEVVDIKEIVEKIEESEVSILKEELIIKIPKVKSEIIRIKPNLIDNLPEPEYIPEINTQREGNRLLAIALESSTSNIFSGKNIIVLVSSILIILMWTFVLKIKV